MAVNGRASIVSHTPEGVTRTTAADLGETAGRIATALRKRGLGDGSVIASFGATTCEHLLFYLSVPAIGAVLHTLNVRLHREHIVFMANEARDKAIFVDDGFAPLAAAFVSDIPSLQLVVVAGPSMPDAFRRCGIETILLDDLVREGDPGYDWPDVAEDEAAVLCYTGGTTGLPKGVCYSHRALWLQASSLTTTNSVGLSCRDRLLLAVSLFHVCGWGLPYAALMSGAGLVLPGTGMGAAKVLELIVGERPTVAAGVPTIWMDAMAEARRRDWPDFGNLARIACGGAPVPDELVSAYAEHRVEVLRAWGMTETASMSVVTSRPHWTSPDQHSTDAVGRTVAGLETALRAFDGNAVPHDGTAVGEIVIRGPWVTQGYTSGSAPASDEAGWLRTGDLGTIDANGMVRLVDRLKDMIKSGGEWIPSASLENAILANPDVAEVAVIAMPDPRWQERPLAVVVLRDGARADATTLAEDLAPRVARWWLPDVWVIARSIPRTGLGKIDKVLLRETYGKNAPDVPRRA
jgi:fatty-acyl-CoA synthase